MAQTEKTQTAKTSKAPSSDQQPPANKWNTGSLLWGGLLMLVGLLFLLSNLGVISLAWSDIWRLWPIIIIVAGLSILRLQGNSAAIVYSLAAVLIIGLTWLTLTGNLTSDQSAVVSDEFTVNKSGGKVESAAIGIETGASDLNISSHQDDQLVRGTIESRLSDLKYDSKIENNTQVVRLSQQRNWGLFSGGPLNRFDISLSEQLPTDLTIDAGASSIDADLSAVLLKSVLIDSGASSIKLRIGAKLDRTDVRIDTGVSSVTIYVPEASGVKLNIDSGLSSRQLPDGFDETSEDTYQSPGYDQASHKITIDVDMGVSSFKLLTY